MAKFEFVLTGSCEPLRVEVLANDLGQLAETLSTQRFVQGELEPDAWGEIKRVLLPCSRIHLVVEAD